jgi:hypothetical protein
VFLTAGHCVRSLDPAGLQLRLPSTSNTNVYEVEAIIRHDSADVAVLHAQGVSEGDITWPQYQIFDDRAWGEEYEENGKTFREHYHNVINYGVPLWLPSISNWIDIAVPPVPQEELNRRAANQQQLRESEGKV